MFPYRTHLRELPAIDTMATLVHMLLTVEVNGLKTSSLQLKDMSMGLA